MHLSISLLGSFHLQVDGTPVSLSRTSKREALLAYLVVERDRSHARETLDALFFPDVLDKKARINLRQTMTRLRQAIQDTDPTHPFILTTPTTFQFNPDGDYELDVWQFQEGLQGCQAHNGRSDPQCQTCISQLQGAAALYRGEFLADLIIDSPSFELWTATIREQLHQQMVAALQTLAHYYEQRGAYEQSESSIRRLIELEPWREEAHQQLMRLLARQGQRSAALAQYNLCCQQLAVEFAGVEPTAETRALYERIRAGSDKRRHNLPAISSSLFIGRTDELGQILQYLASHERRLITLVGLGGMGKTHLALRVGWQVVTDYLGPFMDGVFFVSLLDAGSAHLTTLSLMSALAESLDVSLASRQPPEAQIIGAIKDKECLLLVDNGEYLNEAGRRVLIKIVQETPSVKILVMSRQRLQLRQETVIEIEGLPYPSQPVPPGNALLGAEVKAQEAVQLFFHRARQVDGRFFLEEGETLTAVVHICQLTKGMPLALELAANWVSSISCRQIAREIEQTLDILATTFHDYPQRHHSIRAVFEHSWRMLGPAEQQTLSHLSIFPGEFSFEAATQVAEATPFILSSLIGQSLLQSHRPAGQEMRYRMHPLLRQFASEKLEVAVRERLYQRHAAYYGRFLQAQQSRLNGLQQPEALQAIQQELPNLRAGWAWAVRHRQLDLMRDYINNLYDFYAIRCWRHEGRELFAQALHLIEANTALLINDEENLVFANLLSRLGEFNYSLGALDQAESLFRQSRTLAHQLEDAEELAFSYLKTGMLAQRRGSYEQAVQFLQFSQQIAQDKDNKRQLGHIFMLLGAIARDQSEYERAQDFFQKSVDVYRAMPFQWGVAHALRLLATMRAQLGNRDEAQAYHQESLYLCRANNDLTGEALNWHNLGQLAQAEQQFEEAERHYRRSLGLFQEAGDKMGMAIVYQALGALMGRLNACERARSYLLDGFYLAAEVQAVSLVLKIILTTAQLFFDACLAEKEQNEPIVTLLKIVYHYPITMPDIKAEAHGYLTQLAVEPEGAIPSKPFFEIEKLVTHLLQRP